MGQLATRLFASLLLPSAVAAQSSLIHFAGKVAGDRLGHAVARVGDLNGDGVADWAAGAPFSDQNGTSSGSVVVYSGMTGVELFEFSGDSALDYFGYAVAGGDVNGDGFGDVIVGAYADDVNGTDSGTVHVYSGSNGSLLWSYSGEAAGDNLGFSVSFVPDVDGDGLGEVVAGAWTADSRVLNNGEALLLKGTNGALLQVWKGESAYDLFGGAVAGVGDVNGDGFGDVLVGAIGNDVNGSGAGASYVYSGATGVLLHAWRGAAAADGFGTSVADAGDVDGDGLSDLLVGAPGSDFGAQNAGRAYLFSSSTGLALFTFVGLAVGDNLGAAIVGDLDATADGTPDIFVGAPAADPVGLSSGQVLVFSGADGSLHTTMNGDAAGARFGAALAAAGDANADASEELLVGAWGTNSGAGAFEGAMYVMSFVALPNYTYNYCSATLNSSGSAASISSVGTTSVSANIFQLNCDGAVANTPGLFFYGPNETKAPFGNGNMCISGSTFRLPTSVSNSTGHVQKLVNFTLPPGPAGTILSGSTWKFQFWFRDTAAGGSNFNLSNGLSATFLP